MLKWLVTFVVASVILSIVLPRLWRLPGDLRFELRGRVVHVPLATSLLLTLLVWALSRVL